tara:strand:- start:6818 stop:8041 length:1224 start_codon:yes stop_codon:yes gene_type:complete
MAIFIGDKAGKAVQNTIDMLNDIGQQYRQERDRRVSAAAQYDVSEGEFATIYDGFKPDLERQLQDIVNQQTVVIESGGVDAERKLKQLKAKYDNSLTIYKARTQEAAELYRQIDSGEILNKRDEVKNLLESYADQIQAGLVYPKGITKQEMEAGEAMAFNLFESGLADATTPLITPIAPSPVTESTFSSAEDDQLFFIDRRVPVTSKSTIEDVMEQAKEVADKYWELNKDRPSNINAAVWTYISKKGPKNQTQAEYNIIISDPKLLEQAQTEYWESQKTKDLETIKGVKERQLAELKDKPTTGGTPTTFELLEGPFEKGGVTIQGQYFNVNDDLFVDLSSGKPVYYSMDDTLGEFEKVTEKEFKDKMSRTNLGYFEDTMKSLTTAPKAASSQGYNWANRPRAEDAEQ